LPASPAALPLHLPAYCHCCLYYSDLSPARLPATSTDSPARSGHTAALPFWRHAKWANRCTAANYRQLCCGAASLLLLSFLTFSCLPLSAACSGRPPVRLCLFFILTVWAFSDCPIIATGANERWAGGRRLPVAPTGAATRPRRAATHCPAATPTTPAATTTYLPPHLRTVTPTGRRAPRLRLLDNAVRQRYRGLDDVGVKPLPWRRHSRAAPTYLPGIDMTGVPLDAPVYRLRRGCRFTGDAAGHDLEPAGMTKERTV